MASKAEQAKYIADDNEAMANTASRMLYAAIGLGLLISIALAILLTRNVLGQLGEDPGYMAQVAGEVARGNLDVTFRAQKRAGGVYEVMRSATATMKEKIAEAEEKAPKPRGRPSGPGWPRKRPMPPKPPPSAPRPRACCKPRSSLRAWWTF